MQISPKSYAYIFAAVLASAVLLFSAASFAQEGMQGSDEFTCYQCHSKSGITPWIATTWAGSGHASKGVICSKCHGNHDTGFDSAEFVPRPGADACADCHPLKVRQTQAGPHGEKVKCSSCHPRHSFSLKVARNPDICVTCHAGSPHVDGYENSKMGVIYKTDGPDASATCQTCHMPGGTHDVGLSIKDKSEMLKVCNDCHSASFAGKALSKEGFVSHW